MSHAEICIISALDRIAEMQKDSVRLNVDERIAVALESIAASLFQISNPLIVVDGSALGGGLPE